MRPPLTSQFLKESEYSSWQKLIEGSEQGSVYSNPVYLDALCRATGGTFRILAARREDELLGGVAMYERKVGSGLRVSPRSLVYYNGVVLRHSTSKYPSQRTAQLLEVSSALEAALSGAGYDGITLRNRSTFADVRAFMSKGWNARPSYSYVVSIDDLALAWDRVEQNLRRLVKRCTNEGLLLSEDDDFDSFWRMHAATTERKGTQSYLPEMPFRRFFATLRSADLCRLYHARLPTGQSVSTQLVLLGKHAVSHSVSAATDPDHLKSGATAFLRWKVFETLSGMGYAANDLTDAAINSVAHFKSQLGGSLELCPVVEKPVSAPSWGQRLRAAVATRIGR